MHDTFALLDDGLICHVQCLVIYAPSLQDSRLFADIPRLLSCKDGAYRCLPHHLKSSTQSQIIFHTFIVVDVWTFDFIPAFRACDHNICVALVGVQVDHVSPLLGVLTCCACLLYRDMSDVVAMCDGVTNHYLSAILIGAHSTM